MTATARTYDAIILETAGARRMLGQLREPSSAVTLTNDDNAGPHKRTVPAEGTLVVWEQDRFGGRTFELLGVQIVSPLAAASTLELWWRIGAVDADGAPTGTQFWQHLTLDANKGLCKLLKQDALYHASNLFADNSGVPQAFGETLTAGRITKVMLRNRDEDNSVGVRIIVLA